MLATLPFPSPVQDRRMADLDLTLQLNQQAYTPRDEIRAEVRLTNVSNRPVLANMRLALNSVDMPDVFREVNLVIEDSTGHEPSWILRIRIDEPGDQDFMELAPRQSVQRSYPLRRFFSFNRSGQYSMRAVYGNQSDPTTGAAWKGTAESNTVTFHLA